jgi:hypothetical protein
VARFLFAVLAIAALFALSGAEPARHLPLPLAWLFWVLSVGVGLALAVASAAWLACGPLARRWPRWPLIGLAGVIGLLLYSPLSLGLEAVFPPMVPDEAGGSWLDRLESSGAAGALAAELLQAGPPYLLTWALLNVAPAAHLAVPRRREPLPAPLSAGWPAPVADPAAEAPPSMAPPTVPASPDRSLAPSAPSAPSMPTASPHAPAPPDAPAMPDPPAPPADTPAPAAPQRAADALGWPAALGDEVLWVTADLHYLHVVTGLGRATVLGSLAAVEAHFGAAGLRIHRSHWVARRAIRRVARGAHGWRCELLDGQRLPISRRRVAAVRALLGRDFVLDDS